MSYSEIIFSIINLAIAIIIGGGQIYIAKSVKDFETKQDNRDEQRRNEQIYADATKFIQKYNRNGYEPEIYLIPLCVVVYKYNPIYPYRRGIYREFCSLTEDVQNEILKRLDINLVSYKYDNYFFDMLNRVTRTIGTYYHYDAQGYYYDNGKYFERALTNHGAEEIPDSLRCELDDEAKRAISSPMSTLALNLYKDGKMNFRDHLRNLLAYHKNEESLSSLSEYFQYGDETTASYICCLIAKYSAIYNQIETDDDKNLGYDCDYSGNRYMEDLFLDTLNTVEHFITAKED